jgi:hypothetical protein
MARRGQLGKDNLGRIAMTVQLRQDMGDMTAGTGHRGHNGQDDNKNRTAATGELRTRMLAGAGRLGQENLDIIAGIGIGRDMAAVKSGQERENSMVKT